MSDTGRKKEVESFCPPPPPLPLNEPKVEFSVGYFDHALWLYAPVASCAVSTHSALTLCNPDSARQAQTQTNYCVSKLLSPLRQTFPLISTPFPEEVSVCLLIPDVPAAFHLQGHWTGSHEGHSCQIITWEDWTQVYIAAKNNQFITTVEDVKVALEHLSEGCLKAGNVGETSMGSHWLHGGLTWQHLSLH